MPPLYTTKTFLIGMHSHGTGSFQTKSFCIWKQACPFKISIFPKLGDSRLISPAICTLNKGGELLAVLRQFHIWVWISPENHNYLVLLSLNNINDWPLTSGLPPGGITRSLANWHVYNFSCNFVHLVLDWIPEIAHDEYRALQQTVSGLNFFSLRAEGFPSESTN